MPFSVTACCDTSLYLVNSSFGVVLSFFNAFSVHEGVRSERQEIQVVRRRMIGESHVEFPSFTNSPSAVTEALKPHVGSFFP